MGSDSGFTACEVTRSGVRQDGIKIAVQILSKYSGVDAFTVGWIHAGGDVRYQGGMWVIEGRTDAMLPAEFAKATKMQSRVAEAFKRGLIVECPRQVIRSDNTKSTGYRVAGSGGVGGSAVGGSTKSVSRDAAKRLKQDNTRVMKRDDVREESKPVAMPAGFMDDLLGGD